MTLKDLFIIRDACTDLLTFPGWLGPITVIEDLLAKTNKEIEEKIK